MLNESPRRVRAAVVVRTSGTFPTQDMEGRIGDSLRRRPQDSRGLDGPAIGPRRPRTGGQRAIAPLCDATHPRENRRREVRRPATILVSGRRSSGERARLARIQGGRGDLKGAQHLRRILTLGVPGLMGMESNQEDPELVSTGVAGN